MGPYIEGNDHVDCNSFYSMGCSPNHTKFSEHLNIVQRLVHSINTFYGVLHLLELFDSQKSPQESKNMN